MPGPKCKDNDECTCQWLPLTQDVPRIGLAEVTGRAYAVSPVTGNHYIATRWLARDGGRGEFVRIVCKRKATEAERAAHAPAELRRNQRHWQILSVERFNATDERPDRESYHQCLGTCR
jgi:hypothetical protein